MLFLNEFFRFLSVLRTVDYCILFVLISVKMQAYSTELA